MRVYDVYTHNDAPISHSYLNVLNNSILSKLLVYSQLIGINFLLAGYIEAETIPPPPHIIDSL